MSSFSGIQRITNWIFKRKTFLSKPVKYYFRLRWRLEHGRSLTGLNRPLPVEFLPQNCPWELKAVGPETHLGGQDLALKGGPFSSYKEAKEIGEKVQAGLLLSSLRQGFGLLILPQSTGGTFTEHGRNWAASTAGVKNVLSDQYGLLVYEDNASAMFIKLSDMSLRISGPANEFVEKWSNAIRDANNWDDRILISYDLFAGARLEKVSRARFLLLVMAIEALVKQEHRSEAEIKLIDKLSKIIGDSEIVAEKKDPLLSGVGMLKYQSISYSCRAYLSNIVSAGIVSQNDAPKFFTECYKLRGKMAHSGMTPNPSTLSTYSNRLEEIVKEILIALFENRPLKNPKSGRVHSLKT